ncbi:MAG: hypothetical protein NUW01_13205 [Gemmatimonadaceae bacterium]|nr:hypothetical protein [Gemmatimonadaceae bacterium]
MPVLTAKEALALKEQLNVPLVRVPQYRQAVDGRMENLDALRKVIAPDYKKTFIPVQTAIPNKALFRLTNIMASNPHEFAAVVRSTDQGEVNLGQDYEDAHVAIDELIFTTEIKRKLRGFIADSYGVVAVDVKPSREVLAKYADRNDLESYAEDDGRVEEEDTPRSKYRARYQSIESADEKAGRTRTKRERHEDAYDAVTTDAMLADGLCITVRVPDILTFRGFQTDGDPHCFAIGMEYGQKQLNPLLDALSGFGLKVSDGLLYIEDESDKRKRPRTASYEALGVGMIAESQSATTSGETWVEYCQIRTCEETLILIEHPAGKKGADGEPGVLIRVPNLFGNKYTGYFLIEGDAKTRSGSLEDRYEPPIKALIVEAQHYNLLRSAYEAMALEESTRAPYVPMEKGGGGIEDSTEETKSVQPQDGVPQVAGEIKRVESTGAKLQEILDHVTQELHLHEPLLNFAGTGAAGESGQHLARAQTAILSELTPYQANVAEVCKRVHACIDAYTIATGETIKIAYAKHEDERTKAEIRELTPKMAKLPIDVIYTIGSRTPEGDWAAEQIQTNRWKDGIIGLTELQRELGYRDPIKMQFETGVDSMLGSVKGVLEGEIGPLLKEYVKQQIQQAFGQPPAPPQPIVDGMPMGGAPPPMPGGMPQPVQMNSASTPVASGGPDAAV